jgi:thiol:disulfide interchange protein DsbD
MRVTAIVSLLALSALISCSKEPQEEVVGGGVSWLISYEEAVNQAEEKERPIMIDFYADWCVWCKRLDHGTYVDEKVVAKAREFVSLKIDADAERAMVTQYRVGGLPTILFIDSDGEEIHRVVGYREPDQFVQEMNVALQAFRGIRDS